MSAVETTADSRASRLSGLMESTYRLREMRDWAPEDLDLDAGEVPYRFAIVTCDGGESWMSFANTLEEAAEDMAGQIQDEYPWAPTEVLDLDTGQLYNARITCELRAV